MSRAVYAKLWGMTDNFSMRKNYGWAQVWSRLAPWGIPGGLFCMWLLFPALDNDYKKMITLGFWKQPTVGTLRSDVPPYE